MVANKPPKSTVRPAYPASLAGTQRSEEEEAAVFLESKNAVLAQLQCLTDSHPPDRPLRMAVAFWGRGADEHIVRAERQYQIVCNLLSGGTNPEVIEALRAMPNVEIRHHSDLHAKVVLADTHAIVGSANFSADGLGFGDMHRPGWIEAAAVIDAADVAPWFESLWRVSSDVTDEALALAEKACAKHGARTAGEPMEPAPQLAEEDLFKPSITGGNAIRMAAKAIEQAYYREIEAESKRSAWIPAYASSILWTAAGNRIATKVAKQPYFERPADVLARAKYPKAIEKLHRFLHVMAEHPDFSPAIRFWANHYLRSLPEEGAAQAAP